MPHFYCDIVVTHAGNGIEAKNKQEYIKKLKEGYYQEFGMDLEDSEIQNITKGG
tara:strand:- start:588 stop:749 length:162 start_codon:yes stop_codon:yes gene_type:complete